MKFFIVGAQCSGKKEVIENLLGDHPEIKVGKLFTNQTTDKFLYRNFEDYVIYSENDIRDIFENKAYIFIQELDEVAYGLYEGLSLYEFENNDVFYLTPDEVAKIPLIALNDDICFIWLDNNTKNRFNKFKLEHRKYSFKDRDELEGMYSSTFVQNIYSFPNSKLLYFYNEDPIRVSAILYAMIQHTELVDEFAKKFN